MRSCTIIVITFAEISKNAHLYTILSLFIKSHILVSFKTILNHIP
jgi:hypothetical protein